MNRHEQDQDLKRTDPRTGLALIVRVYWMLLGYIPILASTAAILESKSGPTAADAAFGASVLSLVLARLYDITRLGGTTAENQPATLVDWRRYAGSVVVIALIVWIVAGIIRTRS